MEIVKEYGFVYITTNNINGMKYVGQRKYSRDWKSYLGSGTRLLRAIKKYGIKNFTSEIIVVAYSKEELNELELSFIKDHNAVLSNDYYNINHGGNVTNAGIRFSEEHRRKIGEAHKGEKNYFYGKKHTEEFCKRVSEANKGHIVSLETREKLRNANRGQGKGLPAWNKGISNSPEARRKISEANKGKHRTEEQKKHLSEATKKLNNEQVAAIREKYQTGKYSQRKLAGEYNCCHYVIGAVVRHETPYLL